MIEIGGLGNCLTDSEEKSAGWSLIEKLSAAENPKKNAKSNPEIFTRIFS